MNKKKPHRFYGHGIPARQTGRPGGQADRGRGRGRFGPLHADRRLVDWLETSGHATVQVGLKRSTLVSENSKRRRRETF
jgi:hypothetical protein